MDSTSNQAAVAATSAIPPLVRLLNATNEGMQETAAQALCNLAAQSTSNRAAIAATGAIPPLVRQLCSSSDKGQAGATAPVSAVVRLQHRRPRLWPRQQQNSARRRRAWRQRRRLVTAGELRLNRTGACQRCASAGAAEAGAAEARGGRGSHASASAGHVRTGHPAEHRQRRQQHAAQEQAPGACSNERGACAWGRSQQ